MAMMIIKTNRNFMRMFTVVVIGIDNVTSYRPGSSSVDGSAVRTSLVADGGCSLGRERERERVYLLEKKHTWHNKTVIILRAGCQKGHSPSCWPPMIYNVLCLTHIQNCHVRHTG